jgi:hypothetical protein
MKKDKEHPSGPVAGKKTGSQKENRQTPHEVRLKRRPEGAYDETERRSFQSRH